jgi:hypothetical protein
MLDMEKDHLSKPQRERATTLIYKRFSLNVIKEEKLLKGIKTKRKEEKSDKMYLINIKIDLIILTWMLKIAL